MYSYAPLSYGNESRNNVSRVLHINIRPGGKKLEFLRATAHRVALFSSHGPRRRDAKSESPRFCPRSRVQHVFASFSPPTAARARASRRRHRATPARGPGVRFSRPARAVHRAGDRRRRRGGFVPAALDRARRVASTPSSRRRRRVVRGVVAASRVAASRVATSSIFRVSARTKQNRRRNKIITSARRLGLTFSPPRPAPLPRSASRT